MRKKTNNRFMYFSEEYWKVIKKKTKEINIFYLLDLLAFYLN